MNKRSQETVGIDPALVSSLEFPRARQRILNDVKSDFIFAPHLSAVYAHAFDELAENLCTELKSGRYTCLLPVTVNVPKVNKVGVHGSHRRGISFTRPGSTLFPKDRLALQMITDIAAPLAETAINRNRCFSNQLLDPDPDGKMFLDNRICWAQMQNKVADLLEEDQYGMLLKADIASYFDNINQHYLINQLELLGLNSSFLKLLEHILSRLTGQMSSRGIVQGVFPSDIFGSLYMSGIDEFFADNDIESVRFVDDMICFFDTPKRAEKGFVELAEKLRPLGLFLNETKTALITPQTFLVQEPDIEKIFGDAIREVEAILKARNQTIIHTPYGMQTIWDDDVDPPDEEDVQLAATERLFDSIYEYPDIRERIEKFCLPIFSRFRSQHAVNYVIERIEQEPALTHLYCEYISNFVDDKNIFELLTNTIRQQKLNFAWQYLWIFGALLKSSYESGPIKESMEIARDSRQHVSLRAIAALYAARFGSFSRHRDLFDLYTSTDSTYLQTAILFGAQHFSKADNKTARRNWSGHSALHRLVAVATEKMAKN
jgi:hypothetical protein